MQNLKRGQIQTYAFTSSFRWSSVGQKDAQEFFMKVMKEISENWKLMV